MEFSKYIVPIFSDGDFNGNGFIINNGMLITAYHVFEDGSRFSFRYDGIDYEIKPDNNLLERDKEYDWITPNISHDLYLCKTNVEGSDLELSQDYCQNQEFEYCGFTSEGNSNLSKDHIIIGRVFRNKALTKFCGRCVELENCMTCIYELHKGNSGGPIFQGKSIVGMLVGYYQPRGGNVESVIMKANYIISEIEGYLKVV